MSETIFLALVIPFVGAFLIALLDHRPNLREAVSLVVSGVLFATVAKLFPHVSADERPTWSFLEILPGLDLSFTIEPLGLVFALLASGLWVVTSVYSIGYMRGHHETNQTRFYVCFALTIGAAIGVAFAGNGLTLFVFYEMMTLVTYPLVTHHGNEEAVRAGRIYLGYLFGTSLGFFFLALTWTWFSTGTLDFKPGGILAGKVGDTSLLFLLALYVFGIGKAALMPFHRWLPAAMVAPTPVSALLHAVAVVKAGVFSVMKILIYIFGIDFLRDTGASLWLMYVAAATILVASIIALTKDNLKARLAYSTVSQLSYIILGVALANSWGVIGGAMHIVMHAFGKITLFFCAGAIAVASHKTKVSEMAYLGKAMPFTMFAFLIGSLSVIGLPPFGGLWSKWYLILGAVEGGHFPLVVVLLVSSLLNIGYLLPVAVRAFFLAPPSLLTTDTIHEAPLACVIPLCITSAGCFVLFFFADYLYEFLRLIVQP
jgi:multicomponent Na+:H+ antiporter subunit D